MQIRMLAGWILALVKSEKIQFSCSKVTGWSCRRHDSSVSRNHMPRLQASRNVIISRPGRWRMWVCLYGRRREASRRKIVWQTDCEKRWYVNKYGFISTIIYLQILFLCLVIYMCDFSTRCKYFSNFLILFSRWTSIFYFLFLFPFFL